MPRKSLAATAADRPTRSTQQRARIEAMTEDQIEKQAQDDEINPEWTDERLERAVFARSVRKARERTGLTQALFAERYHIALARLRDWEQARYQPDSVAAAYVKAIRYDPEAVERALATGD